MTPHLHRLRLDVAASVAQLGTCPRARVGAVLAEDGDLDARRADVLGIVASGWNTTPTGQGCEHPLDVPCPETLHAEAHVLAVCARDGVSTRGLTAYLTLSPCVPCARVLHAAGIARVVYREEYRDPAGLAVLDRLGVPTHHHP